uniref:beta-defensin 43-like n=1 Tax=Jaculus jaculus TaxID=51337 RepID=UPI000332FADF|nr:beta-defensin 43-like [Jaculus jaculus]
MRAVLSILGLLILLSIVPRARGALHISECLGLYHTCRLKCSSDESSARYCEDWTICCRLKKSKREEYRIRGNALTS